MQKRVRVWGGDYPFARDSFQQQQDKGKKTLGVLLDDVGDESFVGAFFFPLVFCR
jgi:hypothetical protein